MIPAELYAQFDIRIPPTVDLGELEATLRSWCDEAGEDVKLIFKRKGEDQTITSIEEDYPWYKAFKNGCQQA